MPPNLSLVIPAYNESRRILSSLERIRQFLVAERIDAEILVVDDGSTDGTADLVSGHARAMEAAGPFRLLRNPGNRGKGYSVRHGVMESRGRRVLFTDTDLSSPIEEYFKLTRPLDAGEASIAVGSRSLEGSDVQVHQPMAREYSGRTFNLLVRLFAGLPFRDTQCGFKLFTREAADAVFPLQTIDGFAFDVEILYIARKLGFRAVEVPVVWKDVGGSRVRLGSGARAFLDVLRIRWQDLRGRYNGRAKRE